MIKCYINIFEGAKILHPSNVRNNLNLKHCQSINGLSLYVRVEHIVLFNELTHSRIELIHEILPIITKIKIIHETNQ
jgi:hypothetical protein